MSLPNASTLQVDRQSTTPFLLKLFYRTGSHHRLDEFTSTTHLSAQHLQIYTWPTCTLRELTHLLTSALPSLLPWPASGTRIIYKLVYPDTRSTITNPSSPGRYLSKALGNVVIGSAGYVRNGESVSGGLAPEALEGEVDKTLQDARFVIGDYVACAILLPLANGAVAPMPLASGGPLREPLRNSLSMGRDGATHGMQQDSGTYVDADAGFRVRGGGRGSVPSDSGRGRGGDGFPVGEWRRGERIPEGPVYGAGSGYRGGRGRGRAR